ncbi:MAG: ribonuclease III [Alphaproteobacteria bacterium]|nr:ribonuclease III [Alphaproteobacteria bacterium]
MMNINKSLLNQALTLSGHGKKAAYERLEFLGDRVVGLVVAELLYKTFPTEAEGPMAKRFVALTREEALAEIADQIGLPDKLITNEDELRHNASVLSDVCEAVVAALYLDKGLKAVKEFMIPLWMPLIQSETQIPQDAKSALQEWSQKKYKELPVYQLVDRNGPDHQPTFTVQVQIRNKKVIGQGNSKKTAEQNAAEEFLKEIKNGYK